MTVAKESADSIWLLPALVGAYFGFSGVAAEKQIMRLLERTILQSFEPLRQLVHDQCTRKLEDL